MDFYVYGDESGTLDAERYDFYTFGGIVCVGRAAKEDAIRSYIAAERSIGAAYPAGIELKASAIDVKHKMALYRATRRLHRFACVIDQQRIDKRIMMNKKNRQRYLDFAFKVALKRELLHLIDAKRFAPDAISDVLISFDEHKTATSGRYELQESIAAEFKNGVVAYDGHFVEPAFPAMGVVQTRFVDSRQHALVRASDIVANVILHKALDRKLGRISKEYVFLTQLP